MKNMMKIAVQDGIVLLTDLTERQAAIKEDLPKTNLADGYIIVQERNAA